MSDNSTITWIIIVILCSAITFCDGKNGKDLHDIIIEKAQGTTK